MGLGPQRTAYGEQVARAGPSLAALTGNIGILGGYAGLMNWMLSFPSSGVWGFTTVANPVNSRVPCNQWPHLFLKGKAGGFPADIKMAIATGGNHLNQGGNLNKAAQALQNENLKYFVVHEQFMTPTAKFADLLLPINSIFERMDITSANGAVVFMPEIIPSLFESKSDYAIFGELANRLGFGDEWTGGKTEEEGLKEGAANSKLLPDWETFKKQQIVRLDMATPIVGYTNQIEKGAKFNTPSGKIEISSARLKEANNPKMPAVPSYIADWESPQDPLSGKYPLQLISPHNKRRVHSSFDNIPHLHETEPHALWMNPVDAEARGLAHMDPIRVSPYGQGSGVNFSSSLRPQSGPAPAVSLTTTTTWPSLACGANCWVQGVKQMERVFATSGVAHEVEGLENRLLMGRFLALNLLQPPTAQWLGQILPLLSDLPMCSLNKEMAQGADLLAEYARAVQAPPWRWR